MFVFRRLEFCLCVFVSQMLHKPYLLLKLSWLPGRRVQLRSTSIKVAFFAAVLAFQWFCALLCVFADLRVQWKWYCIELTSSYDDSQPLYQLFDFERDDFGFGCLAASWRGQYLMVYQSVSTTKECVFIFRSSMICCRATFSHCSCWTIAIGARQI